MFCTTKNIQGLCTVTTCMAIDKGLSCSLLGQGQLLDEITCLESRECMVYLAKVLIHRWIIMYLR